MQKQRRVLLRRHTLVGVPHALCEYRATGVGEELLLRRAFGEEVAVAQVVDFDVFDEAAWRCGASVARRREAWWVEEEREESGGCGVIVDGKREGEEATRVGSVVEENAKHERWRKMR